MAEVRRDQYASHRNLMVKALMAQIPLGEKSALARQEGYRGVFFDTLGQCASKEQLTDKDLLHVTVATDILSLSAPRVMDLPPTRFILPQQIALHKERRLEIARVFNNFSVSALSAMHIQAPDAFETLASIATDPKLNDDFQWRILQEALRPKIVRARIAALPTQPTV